MSTSVDVAFIEPSTPLVPPAPNSVVANPNSIPARRMRPAMSAPTDDPDKYLLRAKALVVSNYNEHHDSPQLSMDDVYIISFTKTLGNWRASIASSVARGLFWDVSFNGAKNEAYIDVYKKLSHARILLGGTK